MGILFSIKFGCFSKSSILVQWFPNCLDQQTAMNHPYFLRQFCTYSLTKQTGGSRATRTQSLIHLTPQLGFDSSLGQSPVVSDSGDPGLLP